MMRRILLVAIFSLLTISARAQIIYYGAAGQPLYARFDDGSNTAVNFTEGSTLTAGRYSAANSAIVSAGLASSTSPYTYRVLIGTAGGQSAADITVGNGSTYWNGTVTQNSVEKYAPLAVANYTAPPTSDQNAVALLDKSLSGHTTSGTAGAGISAASGNLTAQQVADALKLAPTTGSPATGSAMSLLNAASTLTTSNVYDQVVAAFTAQTSGLPDFSPVLTLTNELLPMITSGQWTTNSLANAPTGGAGQVSNIVNKKPIAAKTFALSTRADGTVICTKHCRMIAGRESGPVWIDASAIDGGEYLDQADGLSSSSPGQLAVSGAGPLQWYGVMTVDATNAVAGHSYTVTEDLHVGAQLIHAVLIVDAVAGS